MVNDGLDGLSPQTAVDDALRQNMGVFITLAELADEAIPHVTFFIRARCTTFMQPGEDVLLRSTLECAPFDFRIRHAEETADATSDSKNVVLGDLRIELPEVAEGSNGEV